MAGFWGKRNREQDAADADLAARAQKALVEADERMRLTSDELDFAIAELGDNATADLQWSTYNDFVSTCNNPPHR